MAYFQNFETLVYDVVGDDNPKLFTHILRRVKINDLVKDNILLYDFYQVKPGEKPEDVAFDFYGSAELHWLVLYANNIVDRYHQWPMSVRGFEEYIKDKYTNPLGTPDPNAEFPQEVYAIDRKSSENRELVEFELAAPTDLAGVRIPKRQCTRKDFPSIGTLFNDLEI